jgi:hypothetical protein
MLRWLLSYALLIAVCSFISSGQTGVAKAQDSKSPSRPDFHPAPEVPAMPRALMKLPRTNITAAKFPALDFHFHGARLRTAEDYKALIKLMDETGVGVICNMDGGLGKTFDQNMKVGEPLMIRKFFLKYQDRILFGSDGNPGRGIEEFWVPHMTRPRVVILSLGRVQ